MNNPNALKWEKTYRYGCSTYAGTRYTAEAYLHHYVIDVIGTKSTGQEFILNISCSVPGAQLLEYSGKSKTHLQMIAENYHQAVRKYVERAGYYDVQSLFILFKLRYRHIIDPPTAEPAAELYQDTAPKAYRAKIRDLEKGVFSL